MNSCDLTSWLVTDQSMKLHDMIMLWFLCQVPLKDPVLFRTISLLVFSCSGCRARYNPWYQFSEFWPVCNNWLLGRKEGNVLFNDALNTFFYLRLYGIRHMVKDHSDSERGNLLPPHRLLFPNSSKGSFICIIPQTGYHIPRPLLHQSWSTGWNEK